MIECVKYCLSASACSYSGCRKKRVQRRAHFHTQCIATSASVQRRTVQSASHTILASSIITGTTVSLQKRQTAVTDLMLQHRFANVELQIIILISDVRKAAQKLEIGRSANV
jgi:hypothetical protein